MEIDEVCYFCQNQLEPFKDEENSGNYNDFYSCYKCPSSPFKRYRIWERPYTICIGYSKIRFRYLYFHKSKIWVETFLGQSGFTDIEDDRKKPLLRIKREIKIFNYTPTELERKIKMWLTFS